ncbi:quinone-dependent dihydroorotate dehydrogenase [Maritimibacter sp. DP1N21-5]|uniref:quinone-dependent dihydroorotate dehydrogenase n=1 Tax=Maritimibacter sp. DP1N21-5 TaxID=2836867 RepID=UPI001C489EDC|nr:quinone-dependent dihydroorotate dehydrogenase [Maritimibacter sp. DP1N21-5]MBV7410506.1 quinone-dependent dihydroorotate dehydrogenase [Maritimibacter sp. DP1N21-5]
MNLIEKAGLMALHRVDPERSHRLALMAMKAGFVPLSGTYTSPALATRLAGLDLPNPVGLAAGYDKNAEVVDALTQAGFGWIEVGAITPRAQTGNPKPRLFRLSEDQAVINRFGFNNEGMDAAQSRLAKRNRRSGVPVGLNLGANKDSVDRAADYVAVLERCADVVDFVTVNVSSPNTEKLRDLQGAAALTALLRGVMAARDARDKPLPVFLKIAPDLNADEITEIAGVAREAKLDAIIATNTTLDREGLKSASGGEKGGLSGVPLFEKSTRVLAQLSRDLDGALPLVGVGGISSPADAYAKIRAGASAVQLYSALVYKGLSLVTEIAKGLETHLAKDGFGHISDAVATDRSAWL